MTVKPIFQAKPLDVDDDVEEPAWLVGHIAGLDDPRARVIVEGEDLRWEVNVEGGTFRLEHLEPGLYRVELRAERLVIARRVDVERGSNKVTLRVHPTVAHRIGGPPTPGAPVIRLPGRR